MSRTPTFLFASACVLALGVGAWMLRREPAAPPRDDSRAPPRSVVEATPAHRTSRSRAAEAPDEPAVADAAPARAALRRFTVGVTLRETGAPAVGAKVVVQQPDGDKREATVDAAGIARIEAPMPPQCKEVSGTRISAALDRYLTQLEQRFLFDEEEVRSDLVLYLRERIAGVVLEEDGRPIEGAHATFRPTVEGPIYGRGDRPEATSGADGVFRIESVPAVPGAMVKVSAPRHVSAWVEWTPGDERPLEVRLARAATITGVVRDPDGKPVAGAEVAAHPTAVPDALAAEPARGFTAETDAAGCYVLTKVPLGCTWSVVASHDDFVDSLPWEMSAPDASQYEASRDLALQPGARIDLAVVGPNGNPVTEARVVWGDESRPREVPLEKGGRVSIRVSKPGACRLFVNANGHPARMLSVDVAPGETKPLTVRLDSGAEVAGVVVDDTGAPVAGACIDVNERSPQRFEFWVRTSMSGADGTFRVTGVPEGPRELDVTAERHVRSEAEIVVKPTNNVRVVLQRFGSVSLAPRLPAGAARPKWLSVDLLPCDDRVSEISAYSGDWKDDWPSGGVVEFVPPGQWRVRLRADGYAALIAKFDVAAGASIRLGDVTLAPSLTLAGRVVDATGRGVANAAVGAGGGWCTSDVEGRFAVRGLPSGQCRVWASREGLIGRKFEYTLAPDSPPLVITLLRGGLLRGLLRGAAGDETIDLVPEATDAVPDGETSARVSQFGGFAPRLPAGPWSIVVKRGDVTLATKRVEITEGGETAVEIALPR